MQDSARSDAPRLVVRQPGDAPSFWQPVPANGFARCLLDAASTGSETPFAIGTQTVAAGCHVREHLHPANEEAIFVLEGAGEARIGAARHPMRPGTCLFLPRDQPHAFHAAPDTALTFVWLILPGGLEDFFARIGRPRAEGEAAPAPFPRPPDVLAIEAATVFGVLPPAGAA